jgi:SsrA-binding protein
MLIPIICAMSGIKVLSENRKARFNYNILETLECGVLLEGTEVKSVRSGKFSYVDSYIQIKDNELWLMGLHISPYDFGNIHNHEPVRPRKLLAHKDQIKKLKRKVDEKGNTLVPIKVYLKGSRVKIELAVGQGKRTVDKRNSIKERDLNRETAREAKNY